MLGLLSISNMFCAEYKYILYSGTMYVYSVYPAA